MDNERRQQMLERFEKASELPLLLLALAIIPLLGLPFLVNLSQPAETAFLVADWMIWAVFALELGLRTYLAERRINYLRQHWFDVLIVVLPFLRPLRVVRAARAFRVARLLAFSLRITVDLRRMLQRRGLQYVILGGLVAVLTCASLVFLLERDEGGSINNYGDALWWAVATVTTVGYGDAIPVTPEGRGVATLLMLVGITFFAWITANVAAFLVEFSGTQEQPITIADVMIKLEALERELRKLRGAAHDDG